MTTTRELVQFVADHKSGALPFATVRDRFNGDLTGLQVALDRGLLAIVGNCYIITPDGSGFLREVHAAANGHAEAKECSECTITKPAVQFWKSSSSGDGLFPYCIDCANRKKRQAMEERRRQALNAIQSVSDQLERAAALWDQSARGLAEAWRDILHADGLIRASMRDLGSENESGRMHAHLTFQRAAYVLHMNLTDAKWPQASPFLREVNLPASLAEYIGVQPWRDYVKDPSLDDSKIEGSADESAQKEATPERRQGPQEGGAEQGDSRVEGHDPRSPTRTVRRRASVSGATGKKAQSSRVSATHRPVPTKGSERKGRR